MKWFLIALLATGCRTGLLDPPDLAGVVDGGSARDLRGAPDIAAAVCGNHKLEFVRLAAIERVDPITRFMAAIRVQISWEGSTDCDVAGPVEVTVMPGNATDAVRVIARAWRRDLRTGCAPQARFTRLITLSDTPGLSSPQIVVVDGAPGGTARLDLTMLPPAGANCDPMPMSRACVNDCQCRGANPDARCIPTGMTSGVCAVPCSEDVDCKSEMFPRCGTLALVRSACGGGACLGDGECPFGQRCVSIAGTAKACRPTATTGGACKCSSACGFGQVCSAGACVVPCVNNLHCSVGVCPSGSCQPPGG